MSFTSRLRHKFLHGINWKNVLALGTGLMFIFPSLQVNAAEEIIVSYGALSQSVKVKDLSTFAQTGEMSASIRFLTDIADQNPQQMRQILNRDLGVGIVFLSDILNSSPGEYGLSEIGKVVHTKSRRANVESLRGALLISAIDNKVSLLELFQNYPTQQIYIDGDQLSQRAKMLKKVTNQIDKNLEIPLAIIEQLLSTGKSQDN